MTNIVILSKNSRKKKFNLVNLSKYDFIKHEAFVQKYPNRKLLESFSRLEIHEL